MDELALQHAVHDACPVIEFETPPECAEARSKLREHRFWRTRWIEKTIDALKEKQAELRRELEDCEHAAKVPLLI